MQGCLTIDLGAVVANWRLLGARHAGAVAAVVKADAYGLGAAAVGRALRDAGCGTFFVAQLEEGMALREALGPGPAIAVLNGFARGKDGRAGLLPVLNSLGDVAAHAGRDAILHVDTGMARLGLEAREVVRLLDDPGLLAGVRLRWVMTHLACAETPAHALNAVQRERFAGLTQRVARGVPRSLANSSGMFLGVDFASDLARPGAALYGLNPTPARSNPMRPSVTLAAPILQVREVAAGDSVGYGAAWIARVPSRIATVAAGYADGYLRHLAGAGVVGSLLGRPVPLVGRISMDLITFDVTGVSAAHPGAMLTLLGGAAPSADALAAAAGTIGYEVLTALGRRYRRDYLPA